MFCRRSLAASIVSFALAVLAAAVALHTAADLLRAALPVLTPVGVMTLVGVVAWRWYTRPRGW